MPEVSVVMPCRNTQAFLMFAIDSVCAQTMGDFELIYVDDGSTDKSLEIARQAAAKDSRIRVLRTDQPGSGTAAARNVGIEAARGRFIAFLDSDDYWAPSKLERQLEFMEKTKAVVSHTAYWTVDESGTPLSLRKAKAVVSYRDMLRSNWIGCLTGVFDVGRLGKNYFPPRPLNEDFVFWVRLLERSECIHGLDEPLAFYRVSSASKSSRKVAVALDRWRIYRKDLQMNLAQSAYYWLWYCYYGLRKTDFARHETEAARF